MKFVTTVKPVRPFFIYCCSWCVLTRYVPLIRDNGMVCEILIHGSLYVYNLWFFVYEEFKAWFDGFACYLYMYVACVKAVENCISVVGGKWSQLEIFVVFIINWSNRNSS